MLKIQQYKQKMINYLTAVFPNMTLDEIESKLDEIIESRKEQKNGLSIDISFFDQKSRPVQNVPIDKLDKVLDNKKPLITKYGTTYVQHAEKEALESKALIFAGNERKKEKKLKFDHINDKVLTIMNMHDSRQLTWKTAIMNSYYGVLTAGGSIFRDLDCGESVTASGEEIIMTAIDTFEKFLSNNIHFYDPSDIITYATNILNEEYTKSGPIEKINIETLIDYLQEFFYDRDSLIPKEIDLRQYPSIINFLNTLSDEQLSKIYYKNNLYQYLYDSKLYKKFDIILNKEIPFLNPNGPNATKDDNLKPIYEKEWKDNEKILKEVWSYVKEWVFYNHVDINKYNYCKYGKRRTVLVVK